MWRIGLDAGLTCPNRDGTLDTRGCIFCNPASFSPAWRERPAAAREPLPPSAFRLPPFAGPASPAREPPPPITVQLDEGIDHLRASRHANRCVAYFQPGTNTYAALWRLKNLFEEALSHPAVVGLAIGTRPDCVPDAVLDLLAELSGRTWLSVEYGLQTIHDRSLNWLRRGHRYDAFLDAVRRSRERGLEIGAHVILGLPGESPPDMRATAREITRLGLQSVKIHNLHAVRGTRLAELAAAGQVQFPELTEYAGYVVDFIEQLSPDCVVDRTSGEAPAEILVAPRWCLDKPAVRAAIDAEFRRRDSWQGRGIRG
ncbi:MAG: TIGR01212 family radical SAM protein [Thermoguttaceae bacterium]